ncbi:amidohydrolase [Advenella kashmirensis W13003]|uniref:Amidohydrolase n=1 Tax=Advenella kashmirensis W13003 TaxID=1424334 RepID=V8QW90_9BURK|nr:amidohydrolase [Advenella kashmirensis]ETF04206.1 amidohydrolase [Advenella kashmirensis W13003]
MSQSTPDRAEIRIYRARSIITMNPAQPRATHVAVRDGRILGAGDLASLQGWGKAILDDRFADKFIIPGLIEGHSHLLEGGMWSFVYVGFYDRRGPDGRLWEGLKTLDAVVERLRQVEQGMDDANATLCAWGFDPIYFQGERITTEHLDRVSATRPVVVLHASIHLMNVNSAMLQLAGITPDSGVDGVECDESGRLTGQLQEFAAMYLVFRKIGNVFFDEGQTTHGIWNFARVAQLAGVTTATDLVNDLSPDTLASLAQTTESDTFPLRLVPAYAPLRDNENKGLERVLPSIARNTDKLQFGIVKLIVDGSIQGFTARLRWPHYYRPPAGAQENGIWVIPPQQLQGLIQTYHDAGLTVHIHTNGDEATEVALDALEAVLAQTPRRDHRHTLQHCQMASTAQFRRMAALGVCANLFANHLYYWGDAHYEMTMGPERACRLNAAATALAAGVPISLHSDAPVTPIAPLFTAWCAVNRMTASGRVLGEENRITVQQALHAMTLGAAYTLKLDDHIGSIETGKQADFAILEQDPLAVDPINLKDIPVWGTVLGGRVFPCPQNDA